MTRAPRATFCSRWALWSPAPNSLLREPRATSVRAWLISYPLVSAYLILSASYPSLSADSLSLILSFLIIDTRMARLRPRDGGYLSLNRPRDKRYLPSSLSTAPPPLDEGVTGRGKDAEPEMACAEEVE